MDKINKMENILTVIHFLLDSRYVEIHVFCARKNSTVDKCSNDVVL